MISIFYRRLWTISWFARNYKHFCFCICYYLQRKQMSSMNYVNGLMQFNYGCYHIECNVNSWFCDATYDGRFCAHHYAGDYFESKCNVVLYPIPNKVPSTDGNLYLLLSLHSIRVQTVTVDHHHIRHEFCHSHFRCRLDRRFW